MGFLRDCTGKGDGKEELTICGNGKEKLSIIKQGARVGGDGCDLHVWSKSTEHTWQSRLLQQLREQERINGQSMRIRTAASQMIVTGTANGKQKWNFVQKEQDISWNEETRTSGAQDIKYVSAGITQN